MDENGKIVAHVVVVLKVVEVEVEVVAVVVVVVEVVAAGVEVALCRATCQAALHVKNTCSKMFLTSWTHFADLFFASCRLRTDN